MYNQDKMKELLTERDKLTAYDEYFTEIMWDKMLELLQSREDLDKFAEYMNTEMNHDEFRTLGEIIMEIKPEFVTKSFVEALRKLIIKYPLDIPEHERESQIENVMLRFFEKELAGREKN